MGKISKALEKAEKQNLDRPVAERVRPEMRKAIPQTKSKPVVRSEQHRLNDQAYQDVELAGRPIDRKPPASASPPTTPDDPLLAFSEQEAPPVINPDRKRELSRRSRGLNSRPAADPSVTVAESKSHHLPDPNQKNDGVNISLVKPEIAEPVPPAASLAHATEPETSNPEAKTATTPPAAKNVRVNYYRTKVQVNDPEKLKNNKIFSIFDELETTDQIKILRTQVLRKLKAIGGNSILVTSANPYEGKTFTSINLGVSIAKEFDRTVLIIDADIRKPTLQHTAFSTGFFSLQVEKGLTDYLMEDADISEILINPGIDKLTLIPGGMPVDNSSELLNSGRMEDMMLEIKSRYPSDRVVIVDGPALLPFSDALILSRYVDGVLLVIEAEKTSSEDLKKMMQQLKEVNILGTVLNKNRQ